MRQTAIPHEKGAIGLLILGIVVMMAILFSGGFVLSKDPHAPSPTPAANSGLTNAGGYCCDSGDGDACQPSSDKTFSYNGATYGLLKSNVFFEEKGNHLRDTGQKFENNPIIINTSNEFAEAIKSLPPSTVLATDGNNSVTAGIEAEIECGDSTHDSIFRAARTATMTNDQIKQLCVPIPDDELVYVCKQNCKPSSLPGSAVTKDYLYGDESTVYDVYFRVADGTIPDAIRNCDKSAMLADTGSTSQQIITNIPSQQKNIQMDTFKLKSGQAGKIPGLSPYCKPAIYLYPKERTDVHVEVHSPQALTYTIPHYPDGGWDAVANPDGSVEYENTNYPYLYYETSIADTLLTDEKQGYVVQQNGLQKLFSTLLPKLGLDENEQNAFTDYWLKALPQSPYYFVGVVPPSLLNKLVPLTISPRPDALIRVTLYFQALEKPTSVTAPTITTGKRDGFTVVEWGGLFKKDAKHPFTCLM